MTDKSTIPSKTIIQFEQVWKEYIARIPEDNNLAMQQVAKLMFIRGTSFGVKTILAELENLS